MPEDPSIDLIKLQSDCEKEIINFEGKIEKTNVEPIAFGLKAINIIFPVPSKKIKSRPLIFIRWRPDHRISGNL